MFEKFRNSVMKKVISIIAGAVYSLLSFEIMFKAFDSLLVWRFEGAIAISTLGAFILIVVLWLICTKLFHTENKTFCSFFISAAYVMEVLILIYIAREDAFAFLEAIWLLTIVITIPIALLLGILFLIKRMRRNKDKTIR